MTTTKKPQTTKDRFDRHNERRRRNTSEELLVHSVVEEKTEYGPRFVVEARVTVDLEDGRRLSKVCDIEMDYEDLT